MHAEITNTISEHAGTGQPYPTPSRHLGRAKEGCCGNRDFYCTCSERLHVGSLDYQAPANGIRKVWRVNKLFRYKRHIFPYRLHSIRMPCLREGWIPRHAHTGHYILLGAIGERYPHILSSFDPRLELGFFRRASIHQFKIISSRILVILYK